MSRWSKLQREFYTIRADGLDLQIHCRVYRMQSQRGSADLPRYWITLGKEIIWDAANQKANGNDAANEQITAAYRAPWKLA